MQVSSPITVCIIGVGNTIRSDDGMGAYVCSILKDLQIPALQIMVVHQLDAELVEELVQYDKLVIIDAAVDGDDVSFYELQTADAIPLSSSHHVNAAMLAALAQKVYHKELPLMICAVRGYDFDIGDKLSEAAEANCIKAVKVIQDWLGFIGVCSCKPIEDLLA